MPLGCPDTPGLTGSAREKTRCLAAGGFPLKNTNVGSHLLSPRETTIGRLGFTTVFGMGTGVSPGAFATDKRYLTHPAGSVKGGRANHCTEASMTAAGKTNLA